MNVLEFPALGIKLNLNPVAFSIGDFSVAWYGIIIAAGFLLALWYGLRNAKKYGVNPDKMIDVVIGGIIGGIVGARLYYVIFSWSDYKDDLLKIFRIWEGGLAIYGGLIGAILMGALVCKWRKVKFTAMLDLAGPGFLIGQGIGRWGNFINIEAYGTNTTLPWGMTSPKISSDYYSGALNIDPAITFDPEMPVHPCFLYESLWCLIGFLLIFFLIAKRRRFDGEVFLSYVAWYGAGRMVIEGLRTDSLMIPGTRLRVSQILAGALVIAAVVTIIVLRSKIRRSGDPDMLKPYVLTEGWQEELAAMDAEAKAYQERKARRKAGLPPEEEAADAIEVTTEAAEAEAEAGNPDEDSSGSEAAAEAAEKEGGSLDAGNDEDEAATEPAESDGNEVTAKPEEAVSAVQAEERPETDGVPEEAEEEPTEEEKQDGSENH